MMIIMFNCLNVVIIMTVQVEQEEPKGDRLYDVSSGPTAADAR
jgi:hypothetical protein